MIPRLCFSTDPLKMVKGILHKLDVSNVAGKEKKKLKELNKDENVNMVIAD